MLKTVEGISYKTVIAMNDDGFGHFIMIYHFEKYIVVYKVDIFSYTWKKRLQVV